jgi:two-component sensor histidine kinase
MPDDGAPVSRRASPGGNRAPSTSRLYWVCQAAGWGAFSAYVLGANVLINPAAIGIGALNVVVFCFVAPIAFTHRLRQRMYRVGWLSLPARRLAPRMAAAVLTMAAVLTLLSVLGLLVLFGPPVAPGGVQLSFFMGFVMSLGGWTVIYVAVHAERRHERLTQTARDAQLDALRARMNPHFLFNALNSLRSQITENPEGALEMVTGLAEILRYALNADRRETVRLAEELDIVAEYVRLEQVRFEERLGFEQRVDPAVRDARVPPLIVQTLVENAIKHGIANRREGGLVEVDGRLEDGRVSIVITNPGSLGSETSEGGRGLANATGQLALLYGGAASLTVRDEDGSTRATLVIPLRTSP